MSETQRPTGDDRPTGPEGTVEPIGLSSGPNPAVRTVLARGERVPLPRRLIATGLLAAVLALALHAFPRPYQTIPTGVVRGLGDAYGNLRHTYRNDVAVQEPVAGEASAEERTAYANELWRYRWFGSFCEILLRFSEWLAASCMLVALSMIVVERRRKGRELAARGARTAPTLLRAESLDGRAIVSTPPVPPPAVSAAEAAPRIPIRETGDEVTPPSPTPVPSRIPGTMELRPAQFDDDDDLGRTTEGQALNLAKLPVAKSASSATTTTSAPAALPVFFAERRHPEPHPVVHPGDPPPPAEPMPTPVPGPSPLPLATKEAAATPAATPAAAIAPLVMPDAPAALVDGASTTPPTTEPPAAAPVAPKPDLKPSERTDSLPAWLKKPD